MFTKSYQTEYSNHVHQLLVSVSRHFHVLKNGKIRFQQKSFEYNLKNVGKSSKSHIVHYLVKDHFSGAFYAELYHHHELIPVEDFLFRAWSKKEHFPFCGMPEMLSVPKSVLEIAPGLPGLLRALHIRQLEPTSGYQAGIREMRSWEEELQFAIGFHPTFEEYTHLQQNTLDLCIEINDQVREHNSRIEAWSQHIKDVNIPQDITVFKKDYTEAVRNDIPPQYDELTFHIDTFHDDVEGRFFWGQKRHELFERFYDANDTLHYGSERTGRSLLRKILRDDPQFIDAYNSLGFVDITYQNYTKALKLFRKAYKIGQTCIPEDFSGKILWGVLDNRPFLRTMQGLGVCYLETGNLNKAKDILTKMLHYNPLDNQGIRALAIQCYLALEDYHGVLSICDDYPDDVMADTLYGRVFALLKIEKKQDAERAVENALRYLPLVATELIKTAEHTCVYGEITGMITHGGADQAYEYWKRVGTYWEQYQEALQFIKESLSKTKVITS